MSKIGKKPILIPKEIKVNLSEGKIAINGPMGTKELTINKNLKTVIKDDFLYLNPKNKKLESINVTWGMTRSIINNTVKGLKEGFNKTLEMTGVGYRAALKGNVLNLQLGFSHDVNFTIPEGIKMQVEKQTVIKINGTDKQLVGSVTSKIKSFRPVEPYKGKGIKERGQYVLRKEGKKK